MTIPVSDILILTLILTFTFSLSFAFDLSFALFLLSFSLLLLYSNHLFRSARPRILAEKKRPSALPSFPLRKNIEKRVVKSYDLSNSTLIYLII